MKKFVSALWLIPLVFFLVACSGGEYDSDIDSAIDFHIDNTNEMLVRDYETRENGNIVIHDGGKYITLSFFDPENDMRESSKYYYERAGDTWNEIPEYDGQSLMSKTPDYQEQWGEEI